jgi:asparagine synthase (glutamine-hydrolysing)
MCGIAGIVSLRDGLEPPALEQLEAMAGALRHRGPDETGVYRDGTAGFSHVRLSIIDVATGQQPLCNEDETVWIAFNGEIFNYLELQGELEALGHRFRTRSDTEVIIHAYEAWGEDAFRRFIGQWAVALWDVNARTLVLARDPFGVRPLFLCEREGRVFFASEVKAIFAASPHIPREFDPAGLQQVFAFWTTVSPQTVFKSVIELEPGHVRTYRNGAVRDYMAWPAQYPENDDEVFRGSFEDACEAVREGLETATALRMLRADVPVGSYLSGGLDSSLIAALGLRAKGERFSTFSLRFADAEYDETRYQRMMARHLGSDHHEVVVSRSDIAAVFPDVVYHAERPILRTAPAPLYLLSKLVRDSGIKVVLTGEGADELFAGYDLFREAKVRRFWARQPGSTRRPLLLERLYPYLARSPVAQRSMTRHYFGQDLAAWQSPGFGHGPRWRGTSALQRLFSDDVRQALSGREPVRELLGQLPASFPRWSPLTQDQYLEIRTLLSGYLLSSQGDRMLMAHSVEGRFPFLDQRLAALANSLPPGYKLRGLREKFVLKKLAEGIVPAEILDRPKQPYRAPDALSFLEPSARQWIEEVGSPAAIRAAGVFSDRARGVLDKCLLRHDGGQFSNTDNMAVVGILSTQLLYDSLIRSRPGVQSAVSPPRLIDRVAALPG